MLLMGCKQTKPCRDVGGIADFTLCRFLLARLTFDSLVGQKTPKAIKGALDNLSRGSDSLDSAYEEAMKRIEDQHPASRDLAKRTLLWITYGQRSLSVAEMQQAVAIELGESDLDPDSTVDYDDIISACTGLVTKDLDSYGCDSLRLVHYSTQEYLERTTTKYFPKAQEYLASSCLTYLLFDVFSGASCTTLQYGDRSNYSDTGVGNEATEFLCFGCKTCWAAEQYEAKRWKGDALRYYPFFDLQLEQYPFYKYAVWYWGYHTESCDDEAIRILTKTFLDDYKRVSGALHFVRDVSWPRGRLKLEEANPGSAMQLAASLGLTTIMSKRLEDGSRLDVEDWSGKTPFSWAVTAGEEHVVNLLMTRKDVNPNVRDWCGKTPLMEAVEKDHIAVVQVLLAYENIDINAKDVDNRSALFYAISEPQSDLRILKLLLAQDDIQVNARHEWGQTALHAVAEGASIEGMRLLLAHDNIQVNERDNTGQTALHTTAKGARVKGMRLLLACGDIELNVRDVRGRTALHMAARHGWNVIQHLLAHGDIQVNTKDKWGQTALHIAPNGDAEGMRLLLARNDIQVNERDHEGQTALHIVAPLEWGTKGTQLLLAHNDIQANIRDNKGRTALHIAPQNRDAEGMRLLLARNDIQVNERDHEGQTALHIVAQLEWGTKGTQLLLAHNDIQANIRDDKGRTALHWAAEYQRFTAVQVLLAYNDIQANIRDSKGQTALHIATLLEWAEGMQLLLAHGNIQANIRDIEGQTALHIAATFQSVKVVQLLLAHNGLDVNATDDNGETALFGAIGNMNAIPRLAIPRLQVIQLLLARGDVDVNTRDMYGSAPLYHAVRSGQSHVVRLLLTRKDLEISTKDGEGGILISLAEDERVKAKREMKSDAYKWIIILLRSYIQEKSSDTTSANITQQNPQRHGHTDDDDDDDDDAAHGTDNVQVIEEQMLDLAVGDSP